MSGGWTDEVDQVIAGDLVAVLSYVTPAGGAVLTPVCPIGLRDRELGRVGFTTPLGNGRKLDRIAADPRVALAFHTRQHGRAAVRTDAGPGTVLVQGRASIGGGMTPQVYAAMEDHVGVARGPIWDRLMRCYYEDRVVVWIDVERIVTDGTGPGRSPVTPQRVPGRGTGPRLDAARAARRVGAREHVLLGYVDAGGFPDVLRAEVTGWDDAGITLVPERPLPPGGRRAGLLGHSFHPGMRGMAVEQHTGWLDVAEDRVRYAPHTGQRFSVPRSKTVFNLVCGLIAIGRQRGRERSPRSVRA